MILLQLIAGGLRGRREHRALLMLEYGSSREKEVMPELQMRPRSEWCR